MGQQQDSPKIDPTAIKVEQGKVVIACPRPQDEADAKPPQSVREMVISIPVKGVMTDFTYTRTDK